MQRTYNDEFGIKQPLLDAVNDQLTIYKSGKVEKIDAKGSVRGLLGTADPKGLLRSEFDLLIELASYEIEISSTFRWTAGKRKEQVSEIRVLIEDYIRYFGTHSN